MPAFSVVYNVFGVFLWAALGGEFLRRAGKFGGSARFRCLAAASAFFLFATSDAVEIQTGAWWRLLAWKAACVVVPASLYLENPTH